ncbi:hypothetical protein [Ramlibacter albus]|uniref:Uncharacterized protein n=1 Tax=Ramlibacter albus TaxID=2079448 RepID=A0A923S1F0_9BURK|nr:hypothetical protein [Ramlibacter albus]MBC5764344.1 hypothetical protein [Ramlibacter albus]
MSLFSTSSAPALSREEARERMEEIRRTMTDLASSCGGRASAGLAMRVHYAADVQALWFMRSELMGLLAISRGEGAAREAIEKLGAMFNGLLPEGLRPRTTSLGHGPDDLPLR